MHTHMHIARVKRLIAIIGAAALLAGVLPPVPRVHAVSSWNPTLLVNTESFQEIDAGDGTTDIELRFGGTVNKLYFHKGLDELQFTNDVRIGGNLTATGALASTGVIRTDSNLTINDDATAADAIVTFGNDAGNETLIFSNAFNEFEFSDDLRVTGGLSASGNVMLEGNLTGATVAGFGLPAGGCSGATTDKLLWNAGTGKFSCGSDQTGGASSLFSSGNVLTIGDDRYVRTAGDTMTGALTIDLTTGQIGLNVIETMSGASLRVSAGGATVHGTLAASGSIRTDVNLTINDDQTAADAVVTFGSDGTNETITFANTADRFEFSDDLFVFGHLSGSTLRVSGPAAVHGELTASGAFRADGDITINDDNTAADAILSFGNDAGKKFITFSDTFNEFSIGDDVRVTGNLSASGNVMLEASFTGATLFGFGLPAEGCSSGTDDKVLWDAATGKFSCGADQGGAGGGISYSQAEGMFVNQRGDSMTGGLLIKSGNPTATIDSGLLFEVLGTSSGRVFHAQDILRSSGSLVTESGAILDGTMYVSANNGNVGIGTSTPKAKLDVQGTMSGTALTVTSLKNCGALKADRQGSIGCGAVFKTKGANESVTSRTAMQQDNHLFFGSGAVSSNETWVFRFDLMLWSTSATPDFNFSIGAPSGSSCRWHLTGTGTAGWNGGGHGNCGTAFTVRSNVIASKRTHTQIYGTIIFGSVGANTSGSLMWAQGTSSATASTVFSGSTLMAFKTVGSDVAEIYPSRDGGLLPGMVVSIDPGLAKGVQRSSHPYDPNLVGVISTKPGITIGGEDLIEDDPGLPVFVALVGRVPVMVSDEGGPVAPGDYLTSSSTPGVAMRASEPGPVIGQAMTGWDGPGVGVVTIFIKNTIRPAETNRLEQQIISLKQRVEEFERMFNMNASPPAVDLPRREQQRAWRRRQHP